MLAPLHSEGSAINLEATMLRILFLAGVTVAAAGCAKSGPPPYDPNARVFSEAELKALLGQTVGTVKDRVGVQGSTVSSFLNEDRRLRGMSYRLPGTLMMVFLDPRDPMYGEFSEYASWDYQRFKNARVGGISCRTEKMRIDVGAIPSAWRESK
jgi:hypothetical protein